MNEKSLTENVLIVNSIIRQSEDNTLDNIIQPRTQPSTGDNCCSYIWGIVIDGVTGTGTDSPVGQVSIVTCVHPIHVHTAVLGTSVLWDK